MSAFGGKADIGPASHMSALTQSGQTLLLKAELLHEVLFVPKQPLVIHRRAFPITDRQHSRLRNERR